MTSSDMPSASPRGAGPAGLLARQRIEALAREGALFAAAPIEAGQLQPASLDLRLGGRGFSRARELPAGQGRKRRRPAEEPQPGAGLARRRRGGAGEGHRLYRAADGAARAAAGPFRRGQSEELDRAARHLHPPHRRRLGRFRPCSGGLRRAAVRRDFAAQLQRARARRHAAEPAPPARRRRRGDPRRRRPFAPAMRPRRSSTGRCRCAKASSSTSGSPESRARSSATGRSRTAT